MMGEGDSVAKSMLDAHLCTMTTYQNIQVVQGRKMVLGEPDHELSMTVQLHVTCISNWISRSDVHLHNFQAVCQK